MKKSISVQLFMALATVCITAMLGSVLAWQNYRSVENIMLTATAETVQHLSRALEERRKRLIDLPRTLLQFMTYSPVVRATTLSLRLEHLPQFAEILKANEMLSAVYVGYSNGEFLLVRRVFSPSGKAYFSAPPDGAFVVQSVVLEPDGSLKGEWRFYDYELNLLQTELRPDYRYDPRTRDWFSQAHEQDASVVSSPYVFYTTRQLGFTMSQRDRSSQAVIGMDIAIDDLNEQLERLMVTENTKVALVDRDGKVIAYPDGSGANRRQDDEASLPQIQDLASPILFQMFESSGQGSAPTRYKVEGRTWYGIQISMVTFDGKPSRVLVAMPATELLRGAYQEILRELVWVGLISVLLLVMGWVVSRRISRPLRVLAEQVRARSEFDFSSKVGVSSFITEIQDLNDVLGSMSRTIDDFQAIALALNHGTRLDNMLDAVVQKLVDAFKVESGAVYLVQDDTGWSTLATHTSGSHYPADLLLNTRDDDELVSSLAHVLGSSGHLYVPLKNYKQTLQGVLVLQLQPEQQYSGKAERTFNRFVHEVSSAAAVAIETRQLIEAQRKLLDGIIKLLANAIDAKSPYTGAHCERVPVLAELLIDQVINTKEGPYADFSMDETQRYEFRLAAWLHDCGKISTPESVMDKATKLETQYNRIHEIRTRFEVLWRDAEVAYWQAIADGGDQAILKHDLQRTHNRLQEEFAFVAKANLGGEFMGSDDIERLKQIGAQRWWRHFDNRLGLARHEMAGLSPGAPTLPVQESLLADRPDHIVPWGDRKPPVRKDDPHNIWGFDMSMPDYASNYGELYNLTIQRGTLTPEERFKINEHIVQTIIMLKSLPLPAELRRIPHIAGTHHEKMDGTGYPRRLDHTDLGIPERVMMIADIFEALTAADRPYNNAKSLSESVEIMTGMACSGHIDPELFSLFLSSGTYREYGERFLLPSQLDEVDVQAQLKRLDINKKT